jgi:MFS family permease
MLKFVVLAVGVQDVSSGAAAAAIAPMMAFFPGVSPTNIQLIVTLPNLMVVVMAPLFAYFSTKIQMRKIVVFALICFLVGGASPVFFDSLPLIMIGRVLLGVGSGITIPAAISLIPMFWEGRDREAMMGWHLSMGCIGGIVMQTLGGYLTVIDWHYCFLAYLFPVWVLILVLAKLPNAPEEYMQRSGERDENMPSFFKRLNARSYLLVLVYFVVTVFICTMPTNISIVLEGEGIGNAANAGIALSLFTLGALLGGLFYGVLKRFTSGYAMAIGLVLNGGAFLLIGLLAGSVPEFYLYALLSGIGMGFVIPSYYARVSEIAPKQFVAVGISFIAAAQGLGNFISPEVIRIIFNITGQNVGRFPINLGAVVLIVIGIIVAISFAGSGGNKKARASV